MKPVYQSDATPNNGECFRACIASLFECRLKDVPHFCRKANEFWFDELSAWVMDRYNLAPLLVLTSNRDSGKESTHSMPYGYSILTGPTEHGTLHAVIGFGDADGFREVFNPLPGCNVVALHDIIVFNVLDPYWRRDNLKKIQKRVQELSHG